MQRPRRITAHRLRQSQVGRVSIKSHPPHVPPRLCKYADFIVIPDYAEGLVSDADAGVLAEDPGTAERPLPPQPKQEKVKLGFQLYRPPTLLAQAAPEVLSSFTSYFCSWCHAGNVSVLTNTHFTPGGRKHIFV